MNVFELAAVLSLNTSEYEQGLATAASDGNKASSSITSKFVGAGKAVGKAVVGATATAVAAIGALTMKSVNSYATYEQMFGGVKKLYGAAGMTLQEYAKSVGKSTSDVKSKYNDLNKAQNMVMKNAQKAFMTAGMSVNDYMDTATQFSSSLIKSLGGDTVKAAKYTDTAMRAISDNVNTFGSNIEDVQNAFKGFSRENYTMLDNLKLGYAGTKDGMKELIADANEYGKANGEASNLSIDSFADIITAIQQIQEKQQIAGTTAREAATTIEGSLNSTKAAWSNLVTGFADPDQDLGELISNMFDSLGNLKDNIVPRVEDALTGIAEAIQIALPDVITGIPDLLAEIIPGAVSTLVTLGSTIGTTLTTTLPTALSDAFNNMQTLIPQIISTLGSVFSTAASTLSNSTLLTDFVNMGTQLIVDLSQGFVTGIPQFLAQALPLLLQFTEWLRSNAGTLIDAGLTLIQNLAQGLINSIPVLIAYVPTIITNLAGIINDNAPKILATGVTIITNLAIGLVRAIPLLIANLPKIITAIVSVFTAFNWFSLGKNIVTGIIKGVKNLPSLLKTTAKNAVTGFKGAFRGNGILSAVKGAFTKIPSAVKSIFTKAVSLVKSFPGRFKSALKFSWSLPHLNLPHLSVSGGKAPFGIGGKGSLPSFHISWYKKAMENPYVFSDATLFGAGEAGDEMLYGRSRLMSDIKEATQGTKNDVTINVTVNGADNPEEWGRRMASELRRQVKMA